jgi:fatty acid desaturase
MAAAPPLLTSLPYSQYSRMPRFYVVYDVAWALAALGLSAALIGSGYQAPVQTWAWWLPLLLPVAIYLAITAHVFIHNASHGNFPKPVNRIVGEICGIVVLSKFASWEIMHRRHHRHTDDPRFDPHPATRRYWPYVLETIVGVERTLQQQYLDLYGDTPENRRYEKVRSVLSFLSGAAIAFAWLVVLGAPVFWVLFMPSFVFAALFVIFFNWAGHNAHSEGATIEPTNLDHGAFWILNRMFFGIFYHGNHHKMARMFNPMNLPLRASTAAAAADDE